MPARSRGLIDRRGVRNAGLNACADAKEMLVLGYPAVKQISMVYHPPLEKSYATQERCVSKYIGEESFPGPKSNHRR